MKPVGLWIAVALASLGGAQTGPEYTRESPRKGMVVAFRDGRLLVARGGGVNGTNPAHLTLEDREGRVVREFELKPDSAGGARLRVMTASMTADASPMTAAVSMDLPRHRMENFLFFGTEQTPVPTGAFSCQAIAAATAEAAWCLGAWLGEEQSAGGARSLLYRVTRDGKISGFYPLPVKQDQRTSEGLSRFPALGFPGIWANTDGSVWAWLPGDRKVVRFREQGGRLEAWDVPLPKGGPAGVSLAVTPGNLVVALLPVSQDGWRVAPGPSPVFAVFRLEPGSGAWKKVEGLPSFNRGTRLLGADDKSILIENGTPTRLEWWGAGAE